MKRSLRPLQPSLRSLASRASFQFSRAHHVTGTRFVQSATGGGGYRVVMPMTAVLEYENPPEFLVIIKLLAKELEVGVKNEIVFFAIPANGFFNLVFPIEFISPPEQPSAARAVTNFALSSSVTGRPPHAGAWNKTTRNAAANNTRTRIGLTPPCSCGASNRNIQPG